MKNRFVNKMSVKLDQSKVKGLIKNLKTYCNDNIKDMFYLKLNKFIKNRHNLQKFGQYNDNLNRIEPVMELQISEGVIKSISVSNDDRYICLGGEDKIVRVYDNSCQQTKEFYESSMTIKSVDFHPDSRHFATGGNDMTIRIYEVSRGLVKQITYSSQIQCIKYSKDSKMMGVAGDDGAITIYESNNNYKIKKVFNHNGTFVRSIRFSQDCQLLASTGLDKALRVYNINKGKMQEFWGNQDIIEDIDFSPDCKKVVTVGWDKTIRLFNIENQDIEIVECDDDQIYESVSYSPDGKYIIVAGKGKVIRQIELDSGNIDELHGNYEAIETVCYNHEGNLILSGGHDKLLRIYSVNKKDSDIRKIKLKTNTIQMIDVSRTGRYIAVIAGNKNVYILDTSTEKQYVINDSEMNLSSLQFSNDSQMLVVGGWDRILRVYEVKSCKLIREFYGSKDHILSVSFSHDNIHVASGGVDSVLRIYSLYKPSQQDDQYLLEHSNRVLEEHIDHQNNENIRLNDDGDCSNNLNRTASQSNQECMEFYESKSHINAICFSEDNQMVASAGGDTLVRIYCLKTKLLQKTLNGNVGKICSIQFSHDSKFIASGGIDRILRVFDIKNSKFEEYKGNENAIQSVSFDKYGRRILAVGGDNIIRIFNLETKNSFILDRMVDDFKISAGLFVGHTVAIVGNKNHILIYKTTYQKHQKYFQVLKYFMNNLLKKCYVNEDENDSYYDRLIVPKKLQQYMTVSIQFNINFINFLFKIQDLQLIKTVLEYLIHHKIKLHISSDIYGNNLVESFTNFDIELQQTFIDYLTICQKDINCEPCNLVINKIMKQSLKSRLDIKEFLDSLTLRLDFQLLVNSQDAQKYIFQKDQNIQMEYKKYAENVNSYMLEISSKRKTKQRFSISQMFAETYDLVTSFRPMNKKIIKNQYFFLVKLILDKPEFQKDVNHFIENNILQLIEANYPPNQEIYKSKVLGHLANQQWKQYGHRAYKKQGVYYLIFLSLYTFQQVRFGSQRLRKHNKLDNDREKYTVLVINAISMIMIISQLRSEFNQLRRLNKQYRELYLGKFWNILEVLSNIIAMSLIILDVVFLLSHFQDEFSIFWYQTFMISSLFFYWTVATKYIRAFRKFSFLIQLIQTVLYDMKEFLAFMGLCLLNFFLVFYLYQSHGYQITNYPVTNGKPRMTSKHHDKYTILRWMYLMIIGDHQDFIKGNGWGDTDANQDYLLDSFEESNGGITLKAVFMFILFVVMTLFMNIVMLNILISIIANTFSNFNSTIYENMLYQRIIIINEINRDMYQSQKLKQYTDKMDNYIVIGSFNKNRIESNYSESNDTKIIRKQNRLIGMATVHQDQLNNRILQLEKDNNFIRNRISRIYNILNNQQQKKLFGF